MLIDISPIISEKIAVFPGDQKFEHTVLMSFEEGHHLKLSNLKSTVHLGAHTDAPNHYSSSGCDMAERNLDYYIGPCQVISVTHKVGTIELSDLNVEVTAPRVLFRTLSFPNPNEWNDDFSSVSHQLIDHLANHGVKLIGIDTPSIDPATSKTLDAHQSIARNDMAILEGIVLDHVEDGIYELIALPLKIKDADASPVRAVLRKVEN